MRRQTSLWASAKAQAMPRKDATLAPVSAAVSVARASTRKGGPTMLAANAARIRLGSPVKTGLITPCVAPYCHPPPTTTATPIHPQITSSRLRKDDASAGASAWPSSPTWDRGCGADGPPPNDVGLPAAFG